jgi:hypothetical protein
MTDRKLKLCPWCLAPGTMVETSKDNMASRAYRVVCSRSCDLDRVVGNTHAATELWNQQRSVEDYEWSLDSYRDLTRQLDVLLNGAGAAEHPSLCDIVAQVASTQWKLVRADDAPPESV